MNEIYWITRLNAICNLFTVITIVTSIASTICLISYIVNKNQEIYYRGSTHEKEAKAYKEMSLKLFHWFVPFMVIGILGCVFIPNTKQALLIYGVGGTIDYVKSNPVAKKLPDKCVNALDKWVESWSIEEKTDSIKK